MILLKLQERFFVEDVGIGKGGVFCFLSSAFCFFAYTVPAYMKEPSLRNYLPMI